jgi:predicted transcriptional regulator
MRYQITARKERHTMSTKRDSVAITGDVLRSAEERKTKHRTRIGGRRLQDYLDFLVNRGFLIEASRGRSVTYWQTQKGLELLKQIDDLEYSLGNCETQKEGELKQIRYIDKEGRHIRYSQL